MTTSRAVQYVGPTPEEVEAERAASREPDVETELTTPYLVTATARVQITVQIRKKGNYTGIKLDRMAAKKSADGRTTWEKGRTLDIPLDAIDSFPEDLARALRLVVEEFRQRPQDG